MFHKLRTPLTWILGYGQLLLRREREGLSPRQLDYVRHIVDGGEHLLQLLDDMATLSRAEAGQLALRVEAVDLGALLDEAVAEARALGGSRGQTIRGVADPDLPRISGDPAYLKQVLRTLLGNAVGFTGEGGTISVAARSVSGPGQGPGAWVEISVSDTGIGIDPEDLPRLFAPFARLAPAAKLRPEGAGLALALARRLVTLHGGSVMAASPGEGQGSTFRLLLPERRAGAA
jgi:signal transduction histidine kinase